MGRAKWFLVLKAPDGTEQRAGDAVHSQKAVRRLAAGYVGLPGISSWRAEYQHDDRSFERTWVRRGGRY